MVDRKNLAEMESVAQDRDAISVIQVAKMRHRLHMVPLIMAREAIVLSVDSQTKIKVNQIKVGFKIKIKVDLEINKVAIHKVKVTFNNKTKAASSREVNIKTTEEVIKTIGEEIKTIEEEIRTITKVFRAKEVELVTLVATVQREIVNSSTLQVIQEEGLVQDLLQCSKISNVSKLFRCSRTNARATVEKSIF